MDKWENIELGKIASIYNGSTPSTSVEEFWNGDIVWITPKDLSDQNKKYILKGERNISKTALSKSKSNLLPKGTLLLSSRAPIGLISIASTVLTTNQGFKNIVVNDEILYNEFLYYLLILKKAELNNLGSGTTFKELSKATLEKLKISIPDLSTQKSIAKVLSDLDAKIELNNRINRELEAMAKTLYDYWFVQFDFPFDFAQGKPNSEGKPYKSNGGKMVYNKELKREVPEGWEVKRLEKCIDLFDYKRIPLSNKERETRNGNIPYFGATSILDYIDDYIFDDEYILLAEDGSVMDNEGFPIMQFIWGKTWVNNHAHVIQAKNKEQIEFYFQLLKRIPVVLIKTGSIQMKINQDNLLSHKVLIPNDKLVNKYSEKIKVIRNQLKNNIEQNQHLSSLRDWLLPMLMNGQVTILQAHGTAEAEE